jgi:hypothetical protein
VPPLEIIESGATALELIQKIIKDNTEPALVEGTSLFMGYHVSDENDPDKVYMVLYGGEMDPEQTMGTIVALEHTRVDVIHYGLPDEFKTVRDEVARLRYIIASQKDYTALGTRMLCAIPKGNVADLGKDPLERHQFMASFEVITDPNYVQE